MTDLVTSWLDWLLGWFIDSTLEEAWDEEPLAVILVVGAHVFAAFALYDYGKKLVERQLAMGRTKRSIVERSLAALPLIVGLLAALVMLTRGPCEITRGTVTEAAACGTSRGSYPSTTWATADWSRRTAYAAIWVLGGGAASVGALVSIRLLARTSE